jgi:hypothetical protein
MKYALITEDQIKTIFQAMAYFSLGDDGKSTTGRHLSDEVFKIVKSLKVQEPVATVYDPYDTPGLDWHCENAPDRGTHLYAGEQP